MPVTHVPVTGRQINAADWHEDHGVELTAEEIEAGLGYVPANTSHNHDDRYYTETEIDEMFVDQVPPIPDGIVSGCEVAYIGNLDFLISAGSFYLDEQLIQVASQTISLAAADPTYDRIDALYLDANGIFNDLTGEAADTPSLPMVDLDQLFLTFATVPAGATDLGDQFVTEVIYDEGVDWTETASHGTITIDSTNNPNSGTKCIEGTAVLANQYVKFVRIPSLLFDGDGHLRLDIRTKATWASGRNLLLRWYLGGVAKGVGVVISNGAYGFVTTNTTTYQPVLVPKSAFGFAPGSYVDELRITARGTGGTMGFYIDPIKIITDIETIDEEDHDHLLVAETITGTTYSTTSLDRYVSKLCTNVALCTITLTSDPAVGSRVRVMAMTAAGFAFAAGSGMTLRSRDGSVASAGQYSVAEAHRIS